MVSAAGVTGRGRLLGSLIAWLVVAAVLTCGTAGAGAADARSGGAALAAASSGFPGNTRSHYLTTVATSTLRRAGRVDARDARRVGIRSALVVLDAGSPAGPDGSTRLPDTGRVASPGDIRAGVVAYARAWTAAAGPRLVLVVGTTNAGRSVGAAHGAAWGRLVSAVAADVAGPTLDVRGGFDTEMEFGSPRATGAEIRGFLGATSRSYVDFGSCTCPPRSRPPGRWTVAAREAVASGGGRGAALPEIYATAGGNATEWATLAAWSRRHRAQHPLAVIGVLTEDAACTGPPRRRCAGIDAVPETAWAQLASALGSHGQRLRYASDIGYLPRGGAVRGPLAPVGGPAGLAGLLAGLLITAAATAAYVLHRRGRFGRGAGSLGRLVRRGTARRRPRRTPRRPRRARRPSGARRSRRA